MWWIILFTLSFAVNVVLFFYVRWIIKILGSVNEDMIILQDQIGAFTEHIKSVYELEMFYGDQTLKSLLEHAQELGSLLSEVDLIINSQESMDPDEMGEIKEDQVYDIE